MTDTSSDTSVEESIDTELLEAIDTAQPEAEHPHDHIEKREDMMGDDYNRCKLFSFSLAGDVRRWFMDDLEECGNFGVFWSILSAKLHRRNRCLAIDGDLPTVRLNSSFDTRYIFELYFKCHRFEVNQHLVEEVMLVLLKSDQSASREEVVEEMKDCRSM
ncbi:hypothetical protein F2Q69_00022880 [Brassica cretica]|uniref:Uncharacterized protein n=1 Tax=Brassica cretica TaxID=69181 RepID=A0A8S9Q5I6_BRACR|nr:hypothetical protein F2Q69_00022880 [Brassica cretica]